MQEKDGKCESDNGTVTESKGRALHPAFFITPPFVRGRGDFGGDMKMKLTTDHILILSGALLIGVIGLALGFSYLVLLTMAGYCLWLIHQQNVLNLREREAEIKNRETDADFRSVVVSKLGVLAWNRGELSFWTRNQAQPQIEQENTPENDGENLTALDVALDLDRVIVAGSTRSGKTYFCKQLSILKQRQDNMIFAIDPKDQREDDPWPEGVKVVGAGDNFAEVAAFLDWLDQEKERRGQQMNRISSFPHILIFWDEIADMLIDVPEFQPRYLKILRKYAEYRIDLFIITQSDDYESCGLPKAQLKRNFRCVLFFEYDRFINTRRVFYNTRLKLPTTPETARELSPFRPVSVSGCQDRNKAPFWQSEGQSWDTATQHTEPDTGEEEVCQHANVIRYITYDTLHTSPDMTQEERNIISTYQDMLASLGKVSYNQIALKVFKTKGGRQTGEIKAVLRKYGLINP